VGHLNAEKGTICEVVADLHTGATIVIAPGRSPAI